MTAAAWAFGISAALVAALTLIFSKYEGRAGGRDPDEKGVLKIFNGLSMFLLDRFLWAVIAARQKKQIEKLRAVEVSDKVENVFWLYTVKKLSLCIALLFAVLILGLFCSLLNIESAAAVTDLERPEPGEEVSYDLYAKLGDESEDVQVDVSGIPYTDEEKKSLIEDSYDEAVSEMLGENESLDHVEYSLDFVSSLDNGVQIDWESSDTDVISGSGKIGEDVDEDGELITIYALMSYDDVEIEYEISCVVFPEAAEELTFEEKLQALIDAQNEGSDPVITLPDAVDGESTEFFLDDGINIWIFVFLAVILPFAVFVLKDSDLDTRLKKRNEQMMRDYPAIVEKLRLLINAGMTVGAAWAKTVEDYEKSIAGRDGNPVAQKRRFAYEEMKYALVRMKSGVPEIECYSHFAQRCGLHPYIKLAGILSQNVKRGTKGVGEALEKETGEVSAMRKDAARKKGEEAGTKLLFPMIIMLIVTIVVIIYPALTNIGA